MEQRATEHHNGNQAVASAELFAGGDTMGPMGRGSLPNSLPASSDRDALVSSLLELADWIESHPLRPSPRGPEYDYEPYPMTPDELRDAAEMLETDATDIEGAGLGT